MNTSKYFHLLTISSIRDPLKLLREARYGAIDLFVIGYVIYVEFRDISSHGIFALRLGPTTHNISEFAHIVLTIPDIYWVYILSLHFR